MRRFYGLFGANQFHPVTGQNLERAFVELQAPTKEAAEQRMWEAFGARWNRVVDVMPDALDFGTSGNSPWRIDLPTAVREHLGETVTVRLKISESDAEREAIWFAGRCIAHRPGPGCRVLLGASVSIVEDRWPEDWNVRLTTAVGGAGVVVEVRYISRSLAETAARKDPQAITVVDETSTLGHLGVDLGGARLDISGTFSLEALDVLSRVDATYRELARVAALAAEAVDEVKHYDERILGVEVHRGRVVGVRVHRR